MAQPASTSPHKPRPAWMRHALRWGPFVLILAACAYAARDLDPHTLLATLEGVRIWPMVFALVLAALGGVGHAAYWWVVIRTVHPITLREMTVYTFASSAANNYLPVRGGEALRVWLVRQRHGVALTLSGAIIAIEKAFDITSLLTLVSPLPWLLPALDPNVRHALFVLPCIVAGAVIAIVIAGRFARRWSLLSGFRVVGRPSVLSAGFAFILSSWVCDVCCVLAVLYAVGIPATLDKALVVILSVNVAIAIPTTPGQFGVHELASTAALKMLGVPEAPAIAFAVLYHQAQVVPVVAIWLATARDLTREVTHAQTPKPPDAPAT
jgi:glycosyltransferase 2 family protein